MSRKIESRKTYQVQCKDVNGNKFTKPLLGYCVRTKNGGLQGFIDEQLAKKKEKDNNKDA